MYNVDPGELNKRISVYVFNKTQDDTGAYVDVFPSQGWTKLLERWARIEPLSGKAFYEAAQGQMEITHKITVRYTDRIAYDHVISNGNRRFDVQSLINIGDRNEWLEIMCKESTIEPYDGEFKEDIWDNIDELTWNELIG